MVALWQICSTEAARAHPLVDARLVLIPQMIIPHNTPEKYLNACLAVREKGEHWVLCCEKDVGHLTPVEAFMA
eukprot:229736-Pelagomonas_calceolata.AAC.2